MVVEGKTPNLNPELLRDTNLIEYFIRRGVKGEELSEINRYRIYLKATWLSDLGICDGKSISPTFWYWKPSLMKPQYKWPPQLRPHHRSWENWQTSLHTTYNLSRTLALPDHRRFGPWLPLASTTGWIYSKAQGKVLKLYSKGWKSYCPLLRHQGRSSHRRFIKTED